MFETHGWERRPGSPPLTLSTPLSFATEEGCRSTFWWKPCRRWMKCREKYSRSSSDWDTYGTGDRLLIQSGTPDNLISIPLTQAEADMTSDWWGIGQKNLAKTDNILKFLQVWSFLLRWYGRSLPPVRLYPWSGFTVAKRVIFSSYVKTYVIQQIEQIYLKACDSVLPFQILYDQGVITGFVWQVD